jgi:hypothetical protein
VVGRLRAVSEPPRPKAASVMFHPQQQHCHPHPEEQEQEQEQEQELTLERSSSVLSRGGSGGSVLSRGASADGRPLQPPPETPAVVDDAGSARAPRRQAPQHRQPVSGSPTTLSAKTALQLARGRAAAVNSQQRQQQSPQRRQQRGEPVEGDAAAPLPPALSPFSKRRKDIDEERNAILGRSAQKN